MKQNYRANLDVEHSGAVAAAPDTNTPGGSYYYHWWIQYLQYLLSTSDIYCYRMRDAGLSIKAWMDINDNSYSAVKDVLEAYVGQCYNRAVTI